ncbi:MAG: hypothetical protein Q7S27_00485 [Nanoarchaeota archaeon]|nr:hypothetical protein [Nanoarchaeota archaeon]
MGEIKIELSEELEKKLRELPHIDWSRLIAEHVQKEVYALLRLKAIASKSKLTEEDALKLGREINNSLHNRYKEIL